MGEKRSNSNKNMVFNCTNRWCLFYCKDLLQSVLYLKSIYVNTILWWDGNTTICLIPKIYAWDYLSIQCWTTFLVFLSLKWSKIHVILEPSYEIIYSNISFLKIIHNPYDWYYVYIYSRYFSTVSIITWPCWTL